MLPIATYDHIAYQDKSTNEHQPHEAISAVLPEAQVTANPPSMGNTAGNVTLAPGLDGSASPVNGIGSADISILDNYFGVELRNNILRMYSKTLQNPNAKPFTFGYLYSIPIVDREIRTAIHKVRSSTSLAKM